jgi:hypothetical protein
MGHVWKVFAVGLGFLAFSYRRVEGRAPKAKGPTWSARSNRHAIESLPYLLAL